MVILQLLSIHPSFSFQSPPCKYCGKGKSCCFQNLTRRESAGKGRRHVTQIVSMPTELSKLCPLIIHWREHKSFSAVVSMEGNISFQFSCKSFCQSAAPAYILKAKKSADSVSKRSAEKCVSREENFFAT